VLGKELSFYMTDHETVRAIQSPGYRSARPGAATGMGSRKATGARKQYSLAGKRPPKSKARRSSRKRA
jgi:hypothetical protein